MTFLQISGEEYVEVTAQGPVRMIPVRINVNKQPTCEQIRKQKQELHISAFEYALDELRHQLLGQEEEFKAQFARDICSSDPVHKGFNLKIFVDEN
jgi:hypothetical protein